MLLWSELVYYYYHVLLKDVHKYQGARYEHVCVCGLIGADLCGWCDLILLVLLFLFYSLHQGKTELWVTLDYHLIIWCVYWSGWRTTIEHWDTRHIKIQKVLLLSFPLQRWKVWRFKSTGARIKEKTYQLSKRWQTEADISYTERMSPEADFSSNSTVITDRGTLRNL